jgi:hypothetical protein
LGGEEDGGSRFFIKQTLGRFLSATYARAAGGRVLRFEC